MKVEIWDESGRNIAATGETGDLVITKPFFSMPLTFWGEDGDQKYQDAYFKLFPGVWSQGDFIRQNASTGGYQVLGRSDGVLNPGGMKAPYVSRLTGCSRPTRYTDRNCRAICSH